MAEIALAAVAGAHGVKGELRLKLFSDSVDSLSRQQKLYVGGAVRRLLSVRDGNTPSPGSRGSTTAPPPRPCAARSSKWTARPCRRSRRANIITPT